MFLDKLLQKKTVKLLRFVTKTLGLYFEPQKWDKKWNQNCTILENL